VLGRAWHWEGGASKPSEVTGADLLVYSITLWILVGSGRFSTFQLLDSRGEPARGIRIRRVEYEKERFLPASEMAGS
jgi:hypothetical protein